MNQIITIFKKDTRHLWPEILVSIVLTAALVRMCPYTWAPRDVNSILLQQVAVILLFLVPMSWWLLITRLVQSESLVGNRQFWLTRPYEWKKLLAAKVLFLLAFLYLPIFTAHCLLLIEAGFQPLAYVPGLLYNLLLITAIIVLPLIVIATVTSSFAKNTLTTLGILIGMLGLLVLASVLPSTHAKTPDSGHLTLILSLSIFLSVILIQYVARRLWLSRTILGGVALFGILIVLIPTNGHSIGKAYPQTAPAQLPVQLTFAPDDTHKVGFFGYTLREKEVTLALPFNVSGVPAGRVVSLDNTAITIQAPNGLNWRSPWHGAFGEYYLPSTQSRMILVNIDRAFFEQVKSLPLTINLSLALTELQSEQTSQVSLVPGDFTIPGIGICSLLDMDPSLGDRYYFDRNSLDCRSALRQPRLSYVQTHWTKERPCSDLTTQSPPAADSLTYAWIGSPDNDPAEFSLSPVSFFNLSVRFFQASGLPVRSSEWRLCPGTPLTVTPYHPIARTQTQITISNLKIPAPTKPQLGSTNN